MATRKRATKKKSKTRKYKEIACYTSKTAAKKAQKTMHGKGLTATLVKKANGDTCIKSAGKRKAVTLKKTGQRLAGRKKK